VVHFIQWAISCVCYVNVEMSMKSIKTALHSCNHDLYIDLFSFHCKLIGLTNVFTLLNTVLMLFQLNYFLLNCTDVKINIYVTNSWHIIVLCKCALLNDLSVYTVLWYITHHLTLHKFCDCNCKQVLKSLVSSPWTVLLNMCLLETCLMCCFVRYNAFLITICNYK